MATDPRPDLVLTPISGAARTVGQLLTTFHLLFVAVDPLGDRSSRIVPTAARVLTGYEQADCRIAWLVGGMAADARRLLGRWATDILTFTDPDFEAIKGFGLQSLPAIVHVGASGSVVNAVEGWDPMAWRRLTIELSEQVDWSRPMLPGPRDPAPFEGAPLRPV